MINVFCETDNSRIVDTFYSFLIERTVVPMPGTNE